MKRTTKAVYLGLLTAVGLFFSSSIARADVIDFDSQGLFGPPYFANAGPAQTISVTTSVGVVTFQGGVILTAESGSPNTSSVYATAGPGLTSTGPTNPLVITFPVPVANFSLIVGNGDGRTITYVVADKAGHSQSNAIPFQSDWNPVFESIGTVVTVMKIDPPPDFPPYPYPDPWDFWIDDIGFDAVPEPSALALLVAGLVGLFFSHRRKLSQQNR